MENEEGVHQIRRHDTIHGWSIQNHDANLHPDSNNPNPFNIGDFIHAGAPYENETNIRGFIAAFHPDLCPLKEDYVTLQVQKRKPSSARTPKPKKRKQTLGITNRRVSSRLRNL